MKTQVHREKEFHDKWAETIDLDELLVRESFEAPTAVENRYALEELGPLKGKRILDLGCGSGETSAYFALQGAEVFACDVSSGLLKVAQSLATKYGATVHSAQTDAAKLPYSSETFDCVFGNGILHHVDLDRTAAEIHRVLRPGGKAVFVEPLPYNPIIQLYRMMAKDVRTEDERPLSFRQIHKLKRLFPTLRHREFWLFTLLIFVHFFLVRRWHPSKVRYWKKVIEEGESYRSLFSLLQRFDDFFLKYFPFLRPLCWNTVIVARK